MDWKRILKAARTPIAILIILPGLFLLLKVMVILNLEYLSGLISDLGYIFVLLLMFGSPFILLAVPFFVYAAIKNYELDRKSAISLVLVVLPFVILELGFLLWLGGSFRLHTGPSDAPCRFPAGIECVRYKLSAVTGKLFLEIRHATGYTIIVTGINCTQNRSSDFASNGIITYGSGNNITIPSGAKAIISNPEDPTKPWLNISCTDAYGNLPSDMKVGTPYSGWVYIRYREMDTNITRTITGIFTARYEA